MRVVDHIPRANRTPDRRSGWRHPRRRAFIQSIGLDANDWLSLLCAAKHSEQRARLSPRRSTLQTDVRVMGNSVSHQVLHPSGAPGSAGAIVDPLSKPVSFMSPPGSIGALPEVIPDLSHRID